MNYDQGYKNAMDTILDIMHSRSHSYFSLQDVSILEPLYNEIVNGIVYAKKQFDMDKVKMMINTGNKMFMPSRSRYMPNEITEYIGKNLKQQVQYSCLVGTRKLLVRFGLFDNKLEFSELEYYFQMIVSWIHTISLYSDKSCGRTQVINFYLTDFKKLFPKSSVKILGPFNCNSGSSTVCSDSNTITIYRSEEWFKVFIHETFHSFGLEPKHHCETRLSNYISTLLPIQSNVRVSEAYVETWARLINVVYSAIINSDGRDEFYNILRFSLQIECLFSVYQAVSVLNFMNLDYNSVIDKTSVAAKMMYKENTHVFAYYILSASFMCNIFGFVRWCTKTNTKWLQFYNSNRSCKSFERLIKDSLYSKEMLEICDLFKKKEWRTQGLRFSIVDSVN